MRADSVNEYTARWTEERAEELLALHAAGLTFAEIGKRYGVTYQAARFAYKNILRRRQALPAAGGDPAMDFPQM